MNVKCCRLTLLHQILQSVTSIWANYNLKVNSKWNAGSDQCTQQMLHFTRHRSTSWYYCILWENGRFTHISWPDAIYHLSPLSSVDRLLRSQTSRCTMISPAWAQYVICTQPTQVEKRCSSKCRSFVCARRRRPQGDGMMASRCLASFCSRMGIKLVI